MHEGDTSSNSAEKEKKKRKKRNSFQKESVQSNEICYVNVNVPDSHEEKIDEHQATLDLALAEIDRLANESRHYKQLLQTCGEREHEFKEEIISLRAQLDEERRIENMTNNQLEEKDVQCERLEVEIVSTKSEPDEKDRLYRKLEEKIVSMKNLEERINNSKEMIK